MDRKIEYTEVFFPHKDKKGKKGKKKQIIHSEKATTDYASIDFSKSAAAVTVQAVNGGDGYDNI